MSSKASWLHNKIGCVCMFPLIEKVYSISLSIKKYIGQRYSSLPGKLLSTQVLRLEFNPQNSQKCLSCPLTCTQVLLRVSPNIHTINK